jgi:hypothetical protein
MLKNVLKVLLVAVRGVHPFPGKYKLSELFLIRRRIPPLFDVVGIVNKGIGPSMGFFCE